MFSSKSIITEGKTTCGKVENIQKIYFGERKKNTDFKTTEIKVFFRYFSPELANDDVWAMQKRLQKI